MNAHKEQAQALLAAGLRDRLSLRLLLASGQAPAEAMGFHAQQACEKLIKAVLVIRGVVFGRTHDLAVLTSLCDAHGIPIPADKDALRVLNHFAVRFRYETCPTALVDLAVTAALVDTLTAWAQQTIDRHS
jgi:HEPN domain-containing protein